LTRPSQFANCAVRRISYIVFTGSFITAKAVANDMVANKIQGSIVLIASMSGSIANRVSPQTNGPTTPISTRPILTHSTGPNLQRVQHKQSRRPPTMPLHGARNRPARNPNQHLVPRRKSSTTFTPLSESRLTKHDKYIRTAMTDALLAAEPEVEKTWMAGALLGRLGAPEDFKAPAVFLLSRGSSFMTGTDLRVDGGHTAAV
jgi:NAD(P)-dependent dehydrogenase (short-subunit alcohol dehydrogenase family)